MENVYNTTDPQKLLALKRLEADALLDLLRTINNSELKISQLGRIARNVMLAQLQVRKMAFYYDSKQGWKEGVRMGFAPFSEEGIEELMRMEEMTKVDKDKHPDLSRSKVEYVIPIAHHEAPMAYFLIAEFADTEVEAQNDLIFIQTLGHILAVAIRNRQLFQEKMQQEFLRKELEVAGTIQKQLLISDFSRFKSLDIYGFNIPHHGIGGDFYDVIKKGKGTTFFCIADVSGKGIAAALLMSNVQANLRSLTAQYGSLKDIIRELNHLTFGITSGEKFVSLFLAKMDHRKRILTYVNAGHNPPVFRSGDEVRGLSEGCLILGAFPDIPVSEASLELKTGDGLFMFTDGVVEQTNQEGEMMGREKVIAELVKIKDFSARNVVAHMQHSLESFAGQANPTDDITMLAVTFL
ncbi:MAG: PP2C family protein-serine/threonine phosphatase [Bacteroidota bacterium]